MVYISNGFSNNILSFSQIFPSSKTFSKRAFNNLKSYILEHNGRIFSLIHPGFLKETSGVIPWLFSNRDVKVQKSSYKNYIENLKEYLTRTEEPLFIFKEMHTSKHSYNWLLENSSSFIKVFVNTYPKSPVPIVRNISEYDSPWYHFNITLRDKLLVNRVFIGGELFYRKEDLHGNIDLCGCVGGAYSCISNYLSVQIEEKISFPNVLIRRVSQR